MSHAALYHPLLVVPSVSAAKLLFVTGRGTSQGLTSWSRAFRDLIGLKIARGPDAQLTVLGTTSEGGGKVMVFDAVGNLAWQREFTHLTLHGATWTNDRRLWLTACERINDSCYLLAWSP